MSLLNVTELSVEYDAKKVVDAVSFSVGRGESVGIVGESGSGKSQTALALLGLLPRTAGVSGSIVFDGQELAGRDERELDRYRARRMAMVFQDPMQALNPYLPVGKQLREILECHGIAKGRDANARVVDMLMKVGLPDAERQFHAYPHELSGGMRQRVMIAAALICEPDLLIADEPTTALDVTVQAQILDLLETLRDDTALLLITHDLGIVAGRCERLLVFESGVLVESGATVSVFRSPQHAHTRALLAAAPRIDSGEILAPVAGKTILSIDGACVRYADGGKATLEAVADVSLSVKEGETLAVVGESGSGKSSLARAVLGLIPQSAGQVVFAGKTISGPVEARAASERRDLQLVFQDPLSSLNPQHRVGRIVEEPLRVQEPAMPAKTRRSRVLATLQKVGLCEEHMQRFPHQLSGGQAQRVSIARALVLEPKLLIADEAVSALDGSVREQVLELLQSVQAQTGLAIIFISHDLGVVRSFCHRVAVMYLGRVLEVTGSQSLFGAPRHPYSRALLEASPVPDPLVPLAEPPLRGEAPSLRSPPTGCVFHPRCRFRVERCSTERPLLRDTRNSRVACHRADELDL